MDKVMAQLEGLVAHYEELQEMMADPEVINDTKRYICLLYTSDAADDLLTV